MTNGSTYSGLAIIGALVAFGAFGLAAVLFIGGNASTERLGLLFAMFGTIVAALIGALRADQGAKTGVSTHSLVDGQTAALLDLTAKSSKAEGVLEGKADDQPANGF